MVLISRAISITYPNYSFNLYIYFKGNKNCGSLSLNPANIPPLKLK